MIKVVAKNYVKPEKMDEVISLFKSLIEKTVEEKGCIKYELFVDIKDSAVITMIEEWETLEDLNNHMNSVHFKEIVPLLGEFMAKTGEINVYQKI